MSDTIRKFQRHWLLRQYGDNGQVLPENIEVSNAIDALFARAETAESALAACREELEQVKDQLDQINSEAEDRRFD